MSNQQIDIIPSHKIDHHKWNSCVRHSSNPLIYAYTHYLDHMADNWSGIIVNDYEAVLPVPWRKKYGVRYCYDVPFIQQLGCFTATNTDHTKQLLLKLFTFCTYGDYHFNTTHQIDRSVTLTNYILDFATGYENISNRYNDDLRNNLKKAARQSFNYETGDLYTATEIYKDLYRQRMPHVTTKDFDNFSRLCYYLQQQNNIVVRKVSNADKGLLAIALLLKDEHRLYNMMNSTTEAGRKTEANHFLFDAIFKEFTGSKLIFDFEGSDIAGIKSFYEKFGAAYQPYYRLHFNYLPFPFNLLKR